MPRTAPAPNMIAVPGMNPGSFVAGGGGAGGGGAGGSGGGKGGKPNTNASDGSEDASGGAQSAESSCGASGSDGGSCPNHHGSGAAGKISQGDPVDVASGRVFTPAITDLLLPGPLPLRFSRSYNSASRSRNAGLGFGWTHSFSWTLAVGRRAIRVVTSSGQEAVFSHAEPGTAVLGSNGWLLHRDKEHYIVELPSGTRYSFALAQRQPGDRDVHPLTRIEDRYGNRISLEHRDGVLVGATDSVGRGVCFQTNTRGCITSIAVAVPGGSRQTFVHYEYDEQDHLVRVEDADGAVAAFAYDERNLLIEHRRSIGITIHYRYDRQGRCIETWGSYPGGRDPCLSGEVSRSLSDSSVLAKGIHHCVFEYDEDGFTEVVDAATHHRYLCNEGGKVDLAVSGGAAFSRTYDERGHLISFTDPLGATTRWERDLFGNETLEVDPLGHTTRIERHPNGDIRKIVHPDGGTLEVSYSPGRVAWVDPMKACFEVNYDGRGLTTSTTAPNGVTRRYVYDDQGNLEEVYHGDDLCWRGTYDGLGRLLSEWDGSGAETSYGYSAMGRLLVRTSSDGSAWRYEYDGEGNLVRETDPLGRVTRLVRGGTGSLADVHRPDGSVVRLRYDRQERLVEVYDAPGDVYRIVRDVSGLPIEEKTFDGRTILRTYDAANRTVRIERDGRRVDFERNARGEIIKRVYGDGAEDHLEYDWRGRLVRASNEHGTVAIERNAAGWVTREVQEFEGEEFSVQFQHDAVGRLLHHTTSLGLDVEFRWEDYAHRSHVRLAGAGAIQVQRDPMGRELRRQLPGGATLEYRRDPAGRLRGTRVSRPGRPSAQPAWVGGLVPGVTVDLEYDYDLASQLTSVADAEHGTTRFEHDVLGQLTAATHAGGLEERFRYDVGQNPYEVAEGAPSRSYAPGNRLERRGGTTYRWDSAGRLVEQQSGTFESDAPATTRYGWNSRGLLESVELPDGRRVIFLYDALGRRCEKRLYVPSGNGPVLHESVRFSWSIDQLTHEVHASRARPEVLCRTYCFDRHGTPWAHRDESRSPDGPATAGPWHYYVVDACGRPLRTVAGDGVVTSTLEWTAWGNVRLREGSVTSTNLRWPGQYADPETGLHYNVHRYYAPDLGRYISPDPIELLGGLDAYGYAKNDPTGYVDPTGLVYSRIVDRDGTVLYEGYSTEEAARSRRTDEAFETNRGPAQGTKPCAERRALTKMSDDIRQEVVNDNRRRHPSQRIPDDQIDTEVQRRMQQRFEEEGLSIEAYSSRENMDRHGDAARVDPCSVCGSMFSTLGLESAVVGAKGKRGQFGTYHPGQGEPRRRGRGRR